MSDAVKRASDALQRNRCLTAAMAFGVPREAMAEVIREVTFAVLTAVSYDDLLAVASAAGDVLEAYDNAAREADWTGPMVDTVLRDALVRFNSGVPS